MSGPHALATVTATLQNLLQGVAPSVTTQSPGTARTGTGDQLNIFLYRTYENPTFRNDPLPHEARSGEAANPPLPLVLKYMITAYGNGDDDIAGQQVMGEAMSILHDHPLLGPADIAGITPDSGLQHQVERIRITADELTLDDISKLWGNFQSADYRLSAAYEVSVVFIESTRPSRTPLPVLRRGADDLGPEVSVVPPAVLWGLRFPNQKPAAEFGDVVTLLGAQLSSDHATVQFRRARLDAPIDLAEKWANIIGEQPVNGDGSINVALSNVELRFTDIKDGRGPGLGGLELKTADRDAILAEAKKRDCYVSDDQVDICGTRFYLT